VYFCEKYKDNIVALKLRQSKNIVKELGLRPLKAATEIARAAGLRLVVHVTDSPGTIQETADLLSPGDVFCHLCHNTGTTILDERGKIRPEVFEMQERGILLDMAHGSRNFSLKIARRAISEGLLPDIISSDLSAFSMNRWPAFGFTYILSELLALGMSFPDLIKRCTQDAAKLINRSGTGFIQENAVADIAIFRIVEQDIEFVDVYGDSQRGKAFVKCEMTFKNGIPMFRQFDFY
jgi:predicted amidohydrolase